MDSRLKFLLPVVLLLTWCASLLHLAAGGDQLTTLAFVAATVACGLVALVVSRRAPTAQAIRITTPEFRRLRGSFQQQSRPGVPGRVRARAPGCNH